MNGLFVFVLVIQVITFAVLGLLFICENQLRLGFAQLLLAVVQMLIYSGRMEL